MTLLALAWVLAADGARPDSDGEPWSFHPDDTVTFVDGPTGAVRVHYASAGPSVTVLDDLDEDGVPDLPQVMASTAEDAIGHFTALGFRPMVPEADLGLDALGGSGAIDVYMVEFGGTGDGRFAIDGCSGGVCVGHLLTDNDFSESYYADPAEAAAVLASHELFHGVQAAYRTQLPDWMSEGTATWAEHLYDPTLDDYFGFCGAYLAEPTRSIDSPPAGVATAWTYGTALFFGFLGERLGVGVGPALLEAMEGRGDTEGVDAILDVLDQFDDRIEDAWPVFAAWNLATGRQSGGTGEGWPDASQLRAPPFEVEAGTDLLDDDNRFYPLAATYFQLEHAGGPLAAAFADDPTGLVFGLHPFAGGERQGAVDAAVVSFAPTAFGLIELGEVAAGGYALVGSYPQQAPESTKVRFCVGAPDAAAACLEPDAPDPSDDTATPDGDTGAPTARPEEASAGCGCASPGGSSSPRGLVGWGVGLFALVSRRRRAAGA